MGDLRDWSREANFSDLEERPSSSSSSSSSLCPEAIGEESWRRAEDLTQGIIGKIKPNSVSEQRRRAVIDYVQRLLRGCLQCEVFPFGSVPLKTYLPDGDIDLTAFGGIIAEEAFANDVFSVLEREDKNGAAEFVVKDVQYIRAEVKLVKCIVQNIVVDISFNQLGGLSTLCFLEKVDRLIGKDNLFKRSIILIKAWCYYESRILGAHHGLISTYALETMVLYIFHIFHSSLDGPLAVLYKFLDYYSKFDWEKYCVSLRGPVHVSSLPEFIVETTDKYAGEPLLSNEFLRECAEMFSVPSKAFGANARTFLPKHLNIVDPLKESNNLGRSVSKGNLVRIRSAFTLGARKLEKILSQPEEILSDELRTFFMSTLDRHGSGERPDIQDDGLKYGYNGLGVNASFPYLELSQEDQYNSSKSLDGSGFDGLLNYRTSVHGLFNNVKIPETPTNSKSEVRAQQSLREVMLSIKSLEADDFSKGDSVCKARLFGDARDLASARIENLEMSNDTSKSSPPTEGDCPLASRMNLLAHVDFSSSPDVEPIDGTSEKEQSENSGNVDVSSGTSQISAMGSRHSQHSIPSKNQLANSQKVPSSIESRHQTSQLSQLSMSSEDFVPRHPGLWPSSRTAGTPEPPKSLPDLDGDYECQLNSLQFGKRWFDFAMGAPIPPVSPPLISQYQSKNLWDGMEVVRQSVQPKLEQYSQMPTNALAPRPVFYPRSSPIIPGASFGIEDMPKPRGTGTYFPNMSHYKDRSSTGRGRNQAPVRSPRYNGRNMTFPETGFNDRSDMEPLQTRGKSGSSSDNYYPSGAKVHMGANGTIHPSEKTLQFGSVTEAASSPECSKQPVPVTKPLSNSSKVGVQKLKPASTGTNQDRLPVQSYHLKDEEDFPPLSV